MCRVAAGKRQRRSRIVCGAPNARAGLKSALAQVGAVLPGDLNIKAAKLRGVESQGMLCSAQRARVLRQLRRDPGVACGCTLGRSLREYLDLDEAVLDLNVTPNRGDAMSVVGIAREVAALTGARITGPQIAAVKPAHPERFPVKLSAPRACPRLSGCIVRNVDNHSPTPEWMRERLRRAGVRSISAIVDVTNYVMLELGQPMHAYDLAKLKGGIEVRHARAGEPVSLLDGRDVQGGRRHARHCG